MDEIKPRSGPWSREEKIYISDNCDSQDYRDIARRLRRNEIAVRDYIVKTLGKKVVGSDFALNPEYDIQRSPVWKELKEQLSEEELKTFLYHWSRIVGQFKDDVLPTEELQIIDAIKIEILLGRALKSQRSATKTIEELEIALSKAKREPESPENADLVSQLDRQLAFHRASTVELGKEYNNLLEQKNKLLKDLKATRAERIKNIESSRQTLIGWVTELIRNKGLRKELGLRMEKMRLAMNVEEYRLMEPHKYIDGQIDYPLLNAQTVEKIQKEGQEIE